MKITLTASIIFLSLVVSSSAQSERQRLALPEGIFYYQPAASVFGTEATWINPASLSRYSAGSIQIMADHADGRFADSWGYTASYEKLSTAFRRLLQRDGAETKEYIFAAGSGLGEKLDLGGSYRYYGEAQGENNKRHLWNLGLITKSGRDISIAAVLSNLNRGKIDGQKSFVEQRYSLAYRLLGDKATVAVDMFLSTNNKLSEADYIYHLEFVPVPGLFVNGFLDSDRNFQLGIRANLLRYFTGSKSNFNRSGDEQRSTVFAGMSTLRQHSIIPEPKRRLSVNIGNQSENPVRPFFAPRETPFAELITSLYHAAEDKTIRELIVEFGRERIRFAHAQEIRQALETCKAAGKKVTCYINRPNNTTYYISSVADAILIPPVSQLNLIGLKAELTFYAATLDKLGVKVELLRIGAYKTAAESYTRSASTEENREQVNRLLDDIYDQFTATIAQGRSISQDSVKKIIDGGPYTSEEAIRYGLVDALSYREDLPGKFLTKMPEVSFRRYQSDTLLSDKWAKKPVLALVVAEGEIRSGDAGSMFGASVGVTPKGMKRGFQQALANRDVRGIVLRVDSPGGDALAGEQIHKSVTDAAKKKPLVVSMANAAASGGFYIATPARKLFASSSSITGSIGIFGGKADFSGLYDKIDLGKELYTRGTFAGMLTTIRPFTEMEREKYFSHLTSLYDHFVKLVAENRHLSTDSIDALGRGQIWTGREALDNGLIDAIGGLYESLRYTAHESGLDGKEYEIAIYPRQRRFFALPGLSLMNSITGIFTGSRENNSIPLQSVIDSPDGFLFTRMPFDIEID
ncbi:MAG: S49 family peptidase [candidate division Zixibacteria bacterium]|nr:S49 family peptidase [candidate division Zixibacteria bacterium]